MVPIIYIICGLPYSGKSLLAKELHKEYGWKVVEIDEIKKRHGFASVWEDMQLTDWDVIFDESFSVTKQWLKAGRSVIYDSANLTRESREKLRIIAKELGAESRLVFLNISPEEMISRWRSNEKVRLRHHLPGWALKAAIKSYQPPGIEETPTVIDASVSMTNIIKELKQVLFL